MNILHVYIHEHMKQWVVAGTHIAPAGLSIYETHDVGDEIKYVYTKSRLLTFQLFHKPSKV